MENKFTKEKISKMGFTFNDENKPLANYKSYVISNGFIFISGQISIFKDRVIFKTEDNKTIKSEYAEYNKKDGLIVLKDQVILIDQQNNRIEAEYAEYYENKKLFISKGPTKIITNEGYVANGKNFILDNTQKMNTNMQYDNKYIIDICDQIFEFQKL